MSKIPFKIDKNAVQKALKAAVHTYDNAAILPKAIAGRLLDRLNFICLNPACVVEIGARTGYVAQQLEKQYPEALVVGLDFSIAILQNMSSKRIVGEYEALAFTDQCADLIFSNLTFQWSSNFQQTLQECCRILKPGGLLLFSTVGSDTLKELRSSFTDINHHVHPFYDMHDIGDMLTQLHFINPVVDREQITIHYSSVYQLAKDLKQLGAQNASYNRSKGLMGKTQWRQMLMNYENWREESGILSATVEVVYGHAFGAEEINSYGTTNREIIIPIDKIVRKM